MSSNCFTYCPRGLSFAAANVFFLDQSIPSGAYQHWGVSDFKDWKPSVSEPSSMFLPTACGVLREVSIPPGADPLEVMRDAMKADK
jgi:hypothetical protein